MIVIEFYKGQGLGNQLWTYCSGRSIAENLNVPFILLGHELFKGKDFIDLAIQVGELDQSQLFSIEQKKWHKFSEYAYYDPQLNYISSSYDSRVESLSGINKLDGIFQSERYFFGELDRPRKYLNLFEDVISKNKIADDVCVINLRGGEYKRHYDLILPESYWFCAIENMKRLNGITKFLVVTDDVSYAKALFPQYEILNGDIGDCYATIYNAHYLILSNSSFAYFPTKTSPTSKFVIAPQYWARHQNKFKRWASISNLYISWLWQTPNGELLSYEDCIPECYETEMYYLNKYSLFTDPDIIKSKRWVEIIPYGLRQRIKKILGLFSPKRFG